MNLLMVCTPINRESAFESELRYPLLAALLFRRTYQNANVFIGTTPDAKVPEYCRPFFKVLRFDFAANPLAMSRQMFYSSFCLSEHFTADTVMAGTDVLYGNKPFPELAAHKMLLSYRYHPSQPYCADLVVVRKDAGKFAATFFDRMVKMIAFLPKKVRFFWADQIAMAIEVGKIMDDEFDGAMHRGPRYPDILLAPSDTYLYTPNDIFASIRNEGPSFSKYRNDVQNTDQLMRLMYSKYAIHFKGSRKPWFFALAYMAWRKGWIDPYAFGMDLHPRALFNGAFVEADEKVAA